MRGLTTRALHTAGARKDAHGTLRFPVYDNAAFEYPSAKDMQSAFEGRSASHSYTRISNPTVEDFEQKVRAAADAFGVIAAASGMAAIANVIFALCKTGSNIVTTRALFGNTYSLFERTFKPWGLETIYADMARPEEVGAAINAKTSAVYLETITNPGLQVADIAEICRIAHAKNVPVVVDGTMTTPWLFNSKEFGVDIEVLSSTKYMSGGATSVGGLIIDNGVFDWNKNGKLSGLAAKYGPGAFLLYLRREVFRNLGACLAPHNAYLQSLALETMALRVEKSSANALLVARYLEKHKKVARVNYPGLQGSQYYNIAQKQFRKGYGGILCFELAGREQCFSFMDSLKLVRRATNINDNKSLVLHPASTIYCEYSAGEREKMGVGDELVRFSAGIEDAEDILEDLERGLGLL